jgi:hypothetical protein
MIVLNRLVEGPISRSKYVAAYARRAADNQELRGPANGRLTRPVTLPRKQHCGTNSLINIKYFGNAFILLSKSLLIDVIFRNEIPVRILSDLS